MGIVLSGYFLVLQLDTEFDFEINLLIILAYFGFMVLSESTDLLCIFLALELIAFVFYTLLGTKTTLLAAEGALKYFLIGTLASALFILGVSYIYGSTALMDILTINDLLAVAHTTGTTWMLTLGSTFLVSALLFKIGAVPFHFWLPDAYQSAPFSVLLFLLVFPKIPLFFFLYTINQVFGTNIIILVSILLSALIGSVQAVAQTKLKRFLAYTTIYNNAFFMSLLVTSGAFSIYSLGLSSFLYAVGLIYTVLPLLSINPLHSGHFSALRDLTSLRTSNLCLAFLLVLGFLSAMGMPPFMGFFTKFFVFCALLEKNLVMLTIFLILASILPAYYYLRISTLIFFLPHTKPVFLLSIPSPIAYLCSIICCISILFIFFPFLS
jgi:NADH-quinone oxidoreductase subunit N